MKVLVTYFTAEPMAFWGNASRLAAILKRT